MDKAGRVVKALVGLGMVLLVGLVGYGIWQRGSNAADGSQRADLDYSQLSRAQIVAMAEQINYEGLDFNTILPASEQSGGLPENIEGSAEAEVIIYEYADYQCNHCADYNPIVNSLVEEYDGRVAVVFRGFMLNFTNSIAAASAANAAAKQGYWREYKDLLFANQNVWIYLSGERLVKQYQEYFEQASGGEGNMEKFLADMKSAEVAQKVAFDTGIAMELDLSGTPTFIIDGESVNPGELRSKVRARLN